MARYAAEGAHVTLVTCTLGEEGEILVPELAHLASDQDDAPRPAPHRRARRRLRRAGRPGPPLPRRAGPLARQRDDGHATERPPRRVLARRPGRGDRRRSWRSSARSGPRCSSPTTRTGATATPTTSRPTGSPSRAFEKAGDPALRTRGRGARGSRRSSTTRRCPRASCRRASTTSRRQGEPDFFGVESADELPFGVAGRADRHRDRRARLPRPQGRRRCARTPPRSRSTARSSRCRTTSGSRRWAWSTSSWPGPGRPSGDRETDLFAGALARPCALPLRPRPGAGARAGGLGVLPRTAAAARHRRSRWPRRWPSPATSCSRGGGPSPPPPRGALGPSLCGSWSPSGFSFRGPKGDPSSPATPRGGLPGGRAGAPRLATVGGGDRVAIWRYT